MYRDLLGKKYESGVMDCVILGQEVFRRHGIEVDVSDAARTAVNAIDSDAGKAEFITDVIESTWNLIDKPQVPCLVVISSIGFYNHIGVYIGEGKFIHISKLRQYPTIERLDNPLYANRKFYITNSDSQSV